MITRRTTMIGLASANLLLNVGARAEAEVAPHRLQGSSDDVRMFRRFCEATHPRGPAMVNDAAWDTGWNALAEEADSLSYPHFVVRVLGALAQFRDGHSTIWIGTVSAGGFDLKLPLGARAFYDGLYVTSAKGDATPLLGARITRVGNVEAGELLSRMHAIWPANNPAWTHHDAGIALLPAMLCGLGVIETPETAVRIEAAPPTGHVVHATLHGLTDGAANRAQFVRPQLRQEALAANAGSGNYLKQLDHALYVSFDDLTVSVEEGAAFTRSIFEAMGNPEARRLVIDLRRNGGGNNFLAEALRHGIERSSFNRPGGLYVLIGPQTFSAAQNLANRLEREIFAIFVGEPTGSAPNHYGDARDLIGPATNLTIHVSTLPWFDSLPQDRRQWIFPDLLSPARFADFAAGRDPALDLALTHADEAQANELTRERVFYFGRPSQSGVWTPFWLA
jgi:hypothetical protein